VIDSLALRNFKGFSRIDLDLAPLTLLSGLNAAGKSTVLQALAVLRQSHDAGLLAESSLLLNGELVDLGTGRDILHEDYETNDSDPKIRLCISEAGVPREWTVRYGSDQDVLMVEQGSDNNLAGMILFGNDFQYLRADRIFPSVYFPKSYEMAVRRRFLGVRGEHAVNYLRVHRDDRLFDSALLHSSAKSGSVLDQTTAWMQELCPGVDLQVADLEGTDFVRLDYGFFGTAGIRASNRYRPTNVGFGLTYVLPVVVACITAGPGSLVILENPEAHLHPRGQAVMGQLVAHAAAAGAQLLVETHSDHILNGVRIAVKDKMVSPNSVKFHFFQRSTSGKIDISTPIVGPDGMLSEWPEGFFDEWDHALDRLLS
jgi:predicted ATPase